MAREQGVTLIELMIVVVVIAILASIAVPSYRSYIIRTQRTDATTALLRVRTAQEKFFLQNNRFMNLAEFNALGLNVSEHGHYTLTPGPGAGPAPGFTITAAPTVGGAQASDTLCASFSIDEFGARLSSPGPVDKCWK